MGVLQQELEKVIDDLPRVALADLVREKLGQQGITDPEVVQRVTGTILECDTDHTEIDLPFDLEFTDADLKYLSKTAERLTKRMPDVMRGISKDIARDVAEDFRRQWKTQAAKVADERENLRRKIARRWDEAFSDLRLLLEVCAEYGDSFNQAHLASRRRHNRVRDEAVSRLHIRACRIADEILTMLENGFAEGARARWRTLHEVSITALLIAEGGDALAQRYLDHDAVDRKKALNDHDRASAFAGRDRVRAAERKEIEGDLNRALRKHGGTFRGMYGWAAGQLGLGDNPQFHDLQEVASALATKYEYRLACFDSHASPLTLFQPVHHWDPTLHVPGVFAAGFDGPGTDTAYTLVQVTSVLFGPPWTLDRLVQLQVLSFLRDGVEAKMLAIAKRIERVGQRDIERAMRRPSRPLSLRPRSRHR